MLGSFELLSSSGIRRKMRSSWAFAVISRLTGNVLQKLGALLHCQICFCQVQYEHADFVLPTPVADALPGSPLRWLPISAHILQLGKLEESYLPSIWPRSKARKRVLRWIPSFLIPCPGVSHCSAAPNCFSESSSGFKGIRCSPPCWCCHMKRSKWFSGLHIIAVGQMWWPFLPLVSAPRYLLFNCLLLKLLPSLLFLSHTTRANLTSNVNLWSLSTVCALWDMGQIPVGGA